MVPEKPLSAPPGSSRTYEGIRRDIILATKRQLARWNEAETRVVFGVSHHNHRPYVGSPASFESFDHKLRAGSHTLSRGYDRHRSKAHQRDFWFCHERRR
jgi:hypothetical protein